METATVQAVNLSRKVIFEPKAAEEGTAYRKAINRMDVNVSADDVVVDIIARRKAKAAEAIRVAQALQDYACSYCGAGNPEVYKTDGPTRYVKCRQCFTAGKVCVITEDRP